MGHRFARQIGNDEVMARIVSGVGQITESDIALANASKTIVIGFNVRANAQAKQAAEHIAFPVEPHVSAAGSRDLHTNLRCGAGIPTADCPPR